MPTKESLDRAREWFEAHEIMPYDEYDETVYEKGRLRHIESLALLIERAEIEARFDEVSAMSRRRPIPDHSWMCDRAKALHEAIEGIRPKEVDRKSEGQCRSASS